MRNTFLNKRVFLTGHTGFKGAWMLQILAHLGAIVKGYSLAPQNSEDLYNQIEGEQFCYSSVIGDIRDFDKLRGELVRFQPDFVFHLAAQSLVRASYDFPTQTFDVNVMGTVHVLEAMRGLDHPAIGLMITTDKVYENSEKGEPFVESAALGGYDPYSASKAAAEIAISSYRNSFFHPEQYLKHQKAIASVRAGNVIGGGDSAKDRIIPDIVRAIEQDKAVVLRNPYATRPWQHVLEPLHAYLSLVKSMLKEPENLSTAFNVGPDLNDVLDVATVTQLFIKSYGRGSYEIIQDKNQPHEAQLLMLNNQKIRESIHWHPKYNAQKAIEHTANWYADKSTNAADKCFQQIKDYGF